MAEIDVGNGGLKARPVHEEEQEEEVMGSASRKRLKLGSLSAADLPSSSNFRAKLLINYPSSGGDVFVSQTSSSTSNPVQASSGSSCCESSDFAKDCLRSLDLKTEGDKTEITEFINNGFSRETTPTSSSEVCGEIGEMDSVTTEEAAPTNSGLKPSAAVKMPSKAEIEDFFSQAEKYQQERFADKYNYDIMKDEPLEGRYEWIQLKP